MDLFFEEPILGYGYNYALKHFIALRSEDLPGLDSSLQGILVNFGLLPTVVLFLLVFAWWSRVNFILKLYGETSEIYSTWKLVSVYVVLTLLWAANFNPALLYPFWLVPVLSILMYFGFIAQAKEVFATKHMSDSNMYDSGIKNENIF